MNSKAGLKTEMPSVTHERFDGHASVRRGQRATRTVATPKVTPNRMIRNANPNIDLPGDCAAIVSALTARLPQEK